MRVNGNEYWDWEWYFKQIRNWALDATLKPTSAVYAHERHTEVEFFNEI